LELIKGCFKWDLVIVTLLVWLLSYKPKMTAALTDTANVGKQCVDNS